MYMYKYLGEDTLSKTEILIVLTSSPFFPNTNSIDEPICYVDQQDSGTNIMWYDDSMFALADIETNVKSNCRWYRWAFHFFHGWCIGYGYNATT